MTTSSPTLDAHARNSNMEKLHGVASACASLQPEQIYRTMSSWTSMLLRCYAPGAPGYDSYGGRGIGVCQEWQTFPGFLASMGPRPAGRTIDRIDNNGNYEPANCRWATPTEQARNTRRNRYISVAGEQMVIAEAAKRANVPDSTIWRRLKRGLAPEVACDHMRAPKIKLCANDVMAIRARIQDGEKDTAIAQEFGVSRTSIYMIRTRRIWANL